MSTEKDLQELSNVSSSHFPDRSSKWLIRQREHLYALLQMLASQIADALDFNRVEQVRRSFISDELRTQESDMIFRVPFRNPTPGCEEVIIYILIEHQSNRGSLYGTSVALLHDADMDGGTAPLDRGQSPPRRSGG